MSSLRPASAILLVALLMSPLLCIQLDPSRVSEAYYAIVQSRTIRSTSSEVFNLSLNVSLPYDGHTLRLPPSSRLQEDSLGNPYLSIWEPKPVFPYTFLINSTINIKSEPLRALPDKSDAGSDVSAFLRSSQEVPSSDPALSALALSITANSSDDFEAVAKLAGYVHSLIQYDSTMVGQRPTVSRILDNPQGVCTEYSLLFVTLARAAGYPSRFVGGYAYSADLGGWQGHSWAEVWLGKWVPADPTWLEVGTLDATHIPLTRTIDPDSQTLSVSAMFIVPAGTPADRARHGELELEQELPGAAPIDEIIPLSVSKLPTLQPLSLNFSSEQLPPGGQAVFWTEYSSDRYGLLDASLTPCTGKQGEIMSLAGQKQTLITRPNRTYYVIWEAQASKDLNPDYDYRCPLSLGADNYGPQSLPITISESASADWPVLSAELENSRLLPGEPVRVFVRAPRSMAGEYVHLLSFDLYLSSKIDRDGQTAFEFIPTGPGLRKIYLFSSRGDPRPLVYAVQSASSPMLNLSGPSSPIQAQDSFNATIQVRGIEHANYSAPLRIAWSFEGDRGEIPLSAEGRMSLGLKAYSAGEPLLLVRLLDPSGAELMRSVRSFSIYDISDISVSSSNPQFASGRGVETMLWLKRDGEAHQVRLYIGNESWYVGEQSQLSITLPPGQHAARFSWTDKDGNAREKEFTLAVLPALPSSEPVNFAETADRGYSIDPTLFPLIIAIAAALAIALVMLRRARLGHDGFSKDMELNISNPPPNWPPPKSSW